MEHKREKADELAKLIYERSHDLDRIDSLVKSFKQQHNDVTHFSSPPARADKIGIWKLDHPGGMYYTRDPGFRTEWDFWCKRESFPAATDKRRVILIGESVARGFFYDPNYTLASELQASFDINMSHEQLEIVDLARTDIHMEGTLEVMDECLALKPALVILFCGNNWLSSLRGSITNADWDFLEGAARQEHGLELVHDFFEQRFEKVIAAFMTKVGQFMKINGVPVIMTVPEFNLRDWSSTDTENMLTGMSADVLEEWLVVEADAIRALDRRQYATLEILSRRLISINSFQPRPYEWLAKSLEHFGDISEARNALERGLDTSLLLRSYGSPRMLPFARRIVLKYCSELSIPALDLSKVFATGGLPDNRLFLDYCHLTIKGIKIVAKHLVLTAGTLLNSPVDAPYQEGTSKTSDETIGMAHFFAAVHNIHWGQSYGIAYYHCLRALGASKDAATLMKAFADFLTRKVSIVLCKSYEQAVGKALLKQYAIIKYFLARDSKLTDIELVSAIADALMSAGIDIRNDVEALRCDQHAIGRQPIDLIDSVYSKWSFETPMSNTMLPLFHQARRGSSEFIFIADDTTSVGIHLTIRLPLQFGQDIVKLIVNNQPVAEITASNSWSSRRLDVQAVLTKPGVNKIELCWPVLPASWKKQLQHKPFSYIDWICPVLGEVHSFYIETHAGHVNKKIRHAHQMNTLQ